MRRQGIMFWIIVLLVAFYLIDSLFISHEIHWSSIIIPVAVFGIVFLLYKYPPRKYRKAHQPKIKPSARTMAKLAAERKSPRTEKRKTYPFQVIEGNKGKNDDDLPKYH